jgi:hypothetical protein
MRIVNNVVECSAIFTDKKQQLLFSCNIQQILTCFVAGLESATPGSSKPDDPAGGAKNLSDGSLTQE